MATLNYNGNTYNILYIDANIGANEGDGSTPATALANIPSPLVDKTCYIIRRNADDETIHVDLPQSWYESLYYIMILGMPLGDDPMYNLMEADAKNLWGADTGKYARVRCNRSSYGNQSGSGPNYYMSGTENHTLFKTNTIRNFYSSNCYFYRDGNGGAQDSYARQFGYIFGFDYGSRFSDITFTKCKFGYTQYNLENDDFIANNTDVSTDTTGYPQYKCQSYIYVTNCNSFSCDNCVINHVYTAHSTSYTYLYTGLSKCFVIDNTNKVIFTNNMYNVMYRNNYGGTESIDELYDGIVIHDSQNGIDDSYSYLSQRTKAIIRNIEINRIYTATGARICAQNIRCDAYDISVDNIKINHKVMHNGTLTGWNSNMTNSFAIWLNGGTSLQVANIFADYSNTNINSARILHVTSGYTTAGNINSHCRNFYIKMDPVGSLNMGGSVVDFTRYKYKLNGSGSDESNIGNNSSWDRDINQLNMSKEHIFDNVVLEATNTTNTVLYAIGCAIKSPYIGGKVYLGSSTLDVKRHYNRISTSVGATVIGSSYYKCDEYEADLSYPNYNGTEQINYDPRSMSSVYVNRSNCILYNENVYTPTYLGSSNNSFICPNYIKSGQLFQRNEVCFCKSWNTVRTGSNAQGSLRFNNNTLNTNNNCHPLIVGHEPYSGIQLVPGSLGKKMLTAYMATKNMDDSETGYMGRIGIHVICEEKYTDYYDPDKTNERVHEFTSESVGWQSDNSTWSGDTNLRTYKCEIPIEVFTLDEPIDVKIWFNWYSVSGYVYVDPDFKLTDIV